MTKIQRARPGGTSRLAVEVETVKAGDQAAAAAVAVVAEGLSTNGHAEHVESVVTIFGDEEPTLATCEAHIAAVTTQWLLGVGRALRAIRDHELFKEAAYPSFEAYVQHRWDMTRQHAHRIIVSVPVVEALADVADREIKEGQARILVPVEKTYGAEAVRGVWDAASRTGKPTAAALERAAISLGYATDDGTDHEDTSPVRQPATALDQLRTAVRPLLDLRRLRDVAREYPEGARQLLADVRTAMAELEADLGTDDEA